MRYITFLIALLGSPLVGAAEPISAPQATVVTYQIKGDFDEIKFNLELAISGHGLKISNTLHISDMLSRTGKDMDMPEHPYQIAESLEFCSALITHQMSQAHPSNMALCPLTISIYSLKATPNKVYLAYQRPKMMGRGETAETTLTELLREIILEAAE